VTIVKKDAFGSRAILETGSGKTWYYRLGRLEEEGLGDVRHLPFSIKVLLEGLLRHYDEAVVTQAHIAMAASWAQTRGKDTQGELPFMPARVLMQDFTGVPAVVDLAAMRSALAELGGDPARINPLIPVDLVIDHSLQVDVAGVPQCLRENAALEFARNRERYMFLRWGQQAFANFRVIPPVSGIVHQINLEYLAQVVQTAAQDGERIVYPDTVIGTDSHTPMVNGLGVLGWGVGGIEAEAAMLGQPVFMALPQVVGFRLTGQLQEGVTATDLTLTITQILRRKGVVGKFVEYFGPGLTHMTLADRATIANMAPDYGATMGFFPIDAETLHFLRQTGRPAALVDLVERYAKAQGLYRTDDMPEPVFSDVVELDLAQVEPSLAGPKRPQDRVPLSQMKKSFGESLTAPVADRGYGLTAAAAAHGSDAGHEIGHGSVVIAAITSCTNTSNPSVLLAAGILAKKAVERGLQVQPHVKTSLAPGSKVVTAYLDKAGLTPFLEQLGFYTVGYGCTTCVGNSGPLSPDVSAAINARDLVVAGVLSGNRNFEGRIHPLVKANYLASPPLVVAYALAGTVDVDLTSQPLGAGADGQPVFLADIWPSSAEIQSYLSQALNPEDFAAVYGNIETSNPDWNAIPVSGGDLYAWDSESTYIQEPPFFSDLAPTAQPIPAIRDARVLVQVGDSVTTDHISPAGSIPADSPAGEYLISLGVEPREFNSYGARRGNDRVMTRGTFANIRLKNELAPGTEGGWTTHLPSGEVMTIFEASQRYRDAGIPVLVLAGKEYGTGSSRDWAAKGVYLLGVRAVLAESFERIHRSNLVGMGVLPLQFPVGQSAESLGLTGHETYTIQVDDNLRPGQEVLVQVTDAAAGHVRQISTVCRLDTAVEVTYYRNGGILQTVLRQLA
jgi:aconitate hydratase